MLRKFLYIGTYGYHEEAASTDSLDLGGLTMTGNIAMGTNKVTGLGAPVDGTDAVTKAYVDSLAISGGEVREFLIHKNQLSNTEGVLSGDILTMQNNPGGGDTITITNGVTTRTYGASGGGDVQYAIGGSPAATMQNLATAITSDASGAWTAVFTTDLDSVDPTGVVVIIEKDSGSTLSKIYGTWAVQTDVEIIDYYGEVEYTKKTLTDLPTSSPTNPQFGIHREVANVRPGEIHYTENEDTQYYWNSDDSTWMTMTGPLSIPDATSASGGGTKGKVGFDSDYGLVVNSGIAKIALSAVTGPGLQFDGTDKGLCIELSATTGPGLLFDGTDKGLAVNLETDGAISFDGVNKGLQVNVDNTTMGISANNLTVNYAPEAQRVENDLTATGAIAKGDAVQWSGTADRIQVATAAGSDYVIGVAKAAISDGNAGAVVSIGPCTGVWTGTGVTGAPYFVQAAGGIGTTVPTAGNRIVRVGYAMNTNDLWVEISDLGKKV